MAKRGGIPWKRILGIGVGLAGAYLLWRIISSRVASTNLPPEVLADPGAYNIEPDGIYGTKYRSLFRHWVRSGSAWLPTLTYGAKDNASAAAMLYKEVVASAALRDTALYKQYMPAIDKLMAKKDYKNALVYLEWLGKKAGLA